MLFLLLQSKRKSIEQWATLWTKIGDDSQKEELREIKEAEDALQSVAEESKEESQTEGEEGRKLKAECKRTVVSGILRTVMDELSKVGLDISELIKLMDETEDDEALHKELDVKFVVKSKLQEIAQGSSSMWSGEWISVAISTVLQNSEKMMFRSINALLKLILYKIVPYDLSFPTSTRKGGVGLMELDADAAAPAEEVAPVPPADVPSADVPVESAEEPGEICGKKSKLSVEKYVIKSKVEIRDGKEKRVWACPYGDCTEKFGSSRKCGAHLNEHLQHIYECLTCKYRSYSLDGYEHHICFAGPKTQGERKVKKSQGRLQKRKSADSPSKGGKKMKLAAATVSKPPVESGSGATVVIKHEDELDLIILE